MDPDWPFADPPDLAVFTVRAVIDGADIMLVSHDVDGDWQFLDGQVPVTPELRVIGLAQAVALEPSVRALADLPRGWIAWRGDAGEPWTRRRHDE